MQEGQVAYTSDFRKLHKKKSGKSAIECLQIWKLSVLDTLSYQWKSHNRGWFEAYSL